jgi:hypothetical protein
MFIVLLLDVFSSVACIPVAAHRPKGDERIDDIYSRSQTDRRLEEADFLKSILERTQQNFIDVSQKPAYLDEKDAEDRQAVYLEQLNMGAATVSPLKNALPSLVALPTSYFSGTHSSESAVAAMATSSVSNAERQYVRSFDIYLA